MMGRNMQLSLGTGVGGSSIGLDQKHQPDMTSSDISSDVSSLLVQAMTS